MTPASTPPDLMASRAVGAVLAGGTRLLSAARQRTKSLHPVGTVLTARLHRHGVRPTTGVAWLDELPGLPAYDWVRRLREPAYATARTGSPPPLADAGDPPGYR
jgi:hypothetical protein